MSAARSGADRAALRQADGPLDRIDLVFGRLIDGQAYTAPGMQLKFLVLSTDCPLMASTKRRGRSAWLFLGFLGVWTGAYFAHLSGMPLDGGALFGHTAALAALMGSVAMCAARAVRRPDSERAAWLLIAVALLMWTAGYAYRTWAMSQPGVAPSSMMMVAPQGAGAHGVSPADLFAVLYYPFAFAGLLLLLRPRVRERPAMLWLDATVTGLSLSAIAALISFESVIGNFEDGSALAGLVAACPAADLLLLGLVLGAFSLAGWRGDRALALLGVGLLAFSIADTNSTAQNMTGGQSPFDGGWWIALVLIAVAAWQRPVHTRPRRLLDGGQGIWLPVGFAVVGLGVLVVAGVGHVNVIAVALAAAALAAVILRLLLTWAAHRRLLIEMQRAALIDALTGLGNRRSLAADLEALFTGDHDQVAWCLALFDLDGFKHFNDTFGHPAGDALLTRLGHNLNEAVAEHGRAYRLGGDEFCALIEGSQALLQERVANAARALDEAGEGSTIGCSHGAITLPEEATDVHTALCLVDQRMYADKRGRLRTKDDQSRHVPLGSSTPSPADHLRDEDRLADQTGRRDGMSGRAKAPALRG